MPGTHIQTNSPNPKWPGGAEEQGGHHAILRLHLQLTRVCLAAVLVPRLMLELQREVPKPEEKSQLLTVWWAKQGTH